MCWECDHPGSTRLDYLNHIREMADRTGWAVQGVERGRHRPPWAYTVGLTRHGKPELLLTGMDLEPSAEVLNAFARHATHEATPSPGDHFPSDGDPVFEFVEVAEPTAHLDVAVEFYGPKIRALQLVYVDDRGHWPWDVGYRGVQPVLGIRAARGG